MNDNLPDMKEYKKYNYKLTPFKLCVLQNFPYIEADFDAITNYQLLCKVVEYLNHVIDNQNTVEDNFKIMTDNLNTLYNFLDTLDLQDEVNNKLDEMVEDGTLARILNNLINKLDYYEITSQTEDEIQELFNIERAKVISFKNDYTFTNTISLNSNTKILLNNHVITFNIPNVYEDYTKSHGFFNFKNTDEFLEYNGNSNISFYNGTIKGGNCSFCHAYNIKFKNIHFLNCQNDHILEMAGINGLLVDNCIFEGQYINTDFKEMIQIDECLYSNFPWFNENNPTYDSTSNKNWIIKNNTFKASSSIQYTFNKGIGSHSYNENALHENIQIINNKFINADRLSVELYQVQNVIIENNEFTKNGNIETYFAHVRLRGIRRNVTIKNNYFSSGYYAIETAQPNLPTENIIIDNNIFENYPVLDNITDSRVVGFIYLRDPIDCEIKNNIIKNFKRTALRCQSTGNTSEDKSIYTTKIINNKFINNDEIVSSFIRWYLGKLFLYDNNFLISNATNPTSQFLVICNDNQNFYQLYSNYNNFEYNTNFTARTIEATETASNITYKEVYGTVKQYTPEGLIALDTLTNQNIYYNAFEFNTFILTMGRGNDSVIVKLKAFNPREKLDTRTWLIPVVKYDNTQFLFSFLQVDARSSSALSQP